MQFIADLHIHSRYARATSRELNLENLHKWAALKGIGSPEWHKFIEAADTLAGTLAGEGCVAGIAPTAII